MAISIRALSEMLALLIAAAQAAYRFVAENCRGILACSLFLAPYIFVGQHSGIFNSIDQTIGLPEWAYADYSWGTPAVDNYAARYLFSTAVIWAGVAFAAITLVHLKRREWLYSTSLPIVGLGVFYAQREIVALSETGWSQEWMMDIFIAPAYLAFGLFFLRKLWEKSK